MEGLKQMINFKERYDRLDNKEILDILAKKYRLTKENKFQGFVGSSNRHQILTRLIHPMWKLESPYERSAKREEKIIKEQHVYQYIKNANYGLNFFIDKEGKTYFDTEFEDEPPHSKQFLESYGCSFKHMYNYVVIEMLRKP